MTELFTNALQIPTLFEGLFVSIHHIAFLLVLPMLAIAILHENIVQIEDKSNYPALFVRVLLIIGLLVIYKQFFITVTQGMDLLSNSIMPSNEFGKVIQSIFTEIKAHKDFGVFNLLKGAMISVVTYITYLLTYVAYTVLIWLRFMLLSLLYAAGPILIVFGIYHKTAATFSSWLKSLFQVAAWSVTLSLLVRIASYMNLMAIYDLPKTNAVSIITANVMFIILFVLTPLITRSLISEGSIGHVGSTMVGIATASTYAFIRKANMGKAKANLRNRDALEKKSQPR